MKRHRLVIVSTCGWAIVAEQLWRAWLPKHHHKIKNSPAKLCFFAANHSVSLRIGGDQSSAAASVDEAHM